MVVVAGLAGCAGVDVKHVRTNPNVNLPEPEAFYIEDFSFSSAMKSWAAESSKRTDYLGKFQDWTRVLSARLRMEMMDLAPAYVLKPTDPLPERGYIIRGDFVRMDEGNPSLRFLPGASAGATEVYAHVRLYRVPGIEVPVASVKGQRDSGEMRVIGGPDMPVMEFVAAGGSRKLSSFAAWEHNITDDLEEAARKINYEIRKRLGYMEN